MFGSTPRVSFQHIAEGTWGQFVTPAGAVNFLLTKARLGKSGTDKERRLTSQLRPVREVLESEKLNFNQLLQRDLDDYRVATDLIPYLLSPKKMGPSFFPPIMTVLLPFDSEKPVDLFPPISFSEIVEDEQMSGVYWYEERAKDSFRIRRMWNHNQNELHEIKLGQVSWNDEAAKLVVLDGQHRAMALIAIDRTINGTWEQNSGTRFRHFYESTIKDILENHKKSGKDIDLDQIEIPVTVCWFPHESESFSNPHGAARKLFIDVNKEARRPSKSRLILLSDFELVNIFSRSLLNRLREENPPLPLYVIEYDNPEYEASRPSSSRWSVITNLDFLKLAIQYTAFCDPKYLRDMSQKFGGRPNDKAMDSRMREELDLGSVFPETLDAESMDRSDISNENFPRSQIDVLRSQFMKGWGTVILKILGEVLPYKSHISAIQQRKDKWITDDALSSLAADAIFVGVGMYWTLKNANQAWIDKDKQYGETKPDIVKAWEIITKGQLPEFQVDRANLYANKTSPEIVTQVNDAFEIMNTHACQLGAMLTISTIADSLDIKMEDLVALSDQLISAWNVALSANVTQNRSRILIFDRKQKSPLNRIAKLEPAFSIYFRYFWLELLCTDEAIDTLRNSKLIDTVQSFRDSAGYGYLKFLIKEQKKAIKRNNPTWSDAKLEAESIKIETRELGKALKYWNLSSQDIFEGWLSKSRKINHDVEINDDLSDELEDIAEEDSNDVLEDKNYYLDED